jgi:hypothetical protein
VNLGDSGPDSGAVTVIPVGLDVLIIQRVRSAELRRMTGTVITPTGHRHSYRSGEPDLAGWLALDWWRIRTHPQSVSERVMIVCRGPVRATGCGTAERRPL